jgi:hypothetical protein
MKIKTLGNELVISIPQGILRVEEIQDFIDLLRYKLIVSKSDATESQIEGLVDEINQNLASLRFFPV